MEALLLCEHSSGRARCTEPTETGLAPFPSERRAACPSRGRYLRRMSSSSSHLLVTALLLPLTACTALGIGSGTRADPEPRPSERPAAVAAPLELGLAGARRPDVLRFLMVRSATNPSLSPDGMEVAFSTRISGTPQVWTVNARSGWPRQLTYGEPVSFHAWSPSGDWILYGRDRAGDEREGFYLIDPLGTPERELIAPSDAFRVFGSFTADGERLVYATTGDDGPTFDIHLLELESGRDRRLMEGRMGLYAAAVRPDGGAVILTEARGEDAVDVHLYDVGARELRTLLAPRVAARYASFSWEPDGEAFYLATDQGRDFSGLARYDLARDRLEFLDHYLGEEDLDRDVEEVALSPDGRFLAWTVNVEGWSRLHVRDLQTRNDLAPGHIPEGVYEIEWASAAPVLAITIRSPVIPGDIWTLDLRTRILHRATRSDPAGLDLTRMVIPTHHSFPARDGVEIHGLLYLPSAPDRGTPPPILIAVHGGPTAQARPTFDAAHQYLLARGVAVFDLNYRGSTGYGKRYARRNDGRLRERELGDIEDALEWLGERGWVDTSRAAIAGASYGGYLSLAALTRLPDRFRAGIAFVGVSDWLTALEGASPELQASDRVEYGDVTDPGDREFFRRLSPLTWVDSLRAPVMLVHGANDPRDPVEQSDRFAEAVRERGGEVEYLRFPDEGHGIHRLENRVAAYRRLAEFLERTLELP